MPPTSRSRGRSLARTPSQSRAMSITGATPKRKLTFGKRFKPKSKIRVRKFKKRASGIKSTIRGSIGPYFKMGSRRAAKAGSTMLRKGVTGTYEYSGISTTTEQVLFLGHTNIPTTKVTLAICMAVVKELLNRAEITPVDPNSTEFGAEFTNYQLIAEYYDNYNSTFTSTASVRLVAAADTMFSIANALNNFWSNSNTDFLRNLKELRWCEPSTVRIVARMHMTNAKVILNLTSDLKIQNRTLAAGTDGNQNTTITQNPLIGRSYEGPGRGSTWIGQSNGAPPTTSGVNFYANLLTGVIDKASFDNSLREPPHPKQLPEVKYSRGVTLAAGEIRTSKVKTVFRVNINKIMTDMHYLPSGSPSANYTPKSYGYFRMFAFEKMLNPKADEPGMTLGFENNWSWQARVVAPKEPIMTSVFESEFKP